MSFRLSVRPVVRGPFEIFVFILISSVGVQSRDAFISYMYLIVREKSNGTCLPRLWPLRVLREKGSESVLGKVIRVPLFFFTISSENINNLAITTWSN